MTSRKNKNNNIKKKRILGFLLIIFSLLLIVSLATHSGYDDRRIIDQDNPFEINFVNQVGIVGAFTSYILFFFFGWISFFIPFLLMLVSFSLLDFGWRKKLTLPFWGICSMSILTTMILNVALLSSFEYAIDHFRAYGGYIFYHLTFPLTKIVGVTGSFLILGGGILVWLAILGYSYNLHNIIWNRPGRFGIDGIGRAIKRLFSSSIGLVTNLPSRYREYREKRLAEKYNLHDDQAELPKPEAPAVNTELELEDKKFKPGNDTARKKVTIKKRITKKPAEIGRATQDYNFPGLDLLEDNPDDGRSVNPDELAFTARALKETLETFDITIDGQIDKYPGPIITRYEFKPAAGVKINRIINLSDDLALALKAKRIRIVAPIPGKAAVGVEIPNRHARLVYLKEILASEVYSDSRHKLPLALGKSISGRPFVTDLTKMPHLLIAGATGSGKSVCINAIITSLIYRLHPEELKLIFIDPKMLELSVYAGIPHLGRPVVTNAKRAEKVLSDAVIEMENRYKKLAGAAVRSIEDYNARQKKDEEKLPYIVIVVDELADMMMASSSSRIEMLITRLAQMARAVGIHLILATQRPSVDVITGLIKANFSARIAFQVATKIDSRTILDCNGAEKLLGNGDMLFLQPGHPEPTRLHGAFISSAETDRLVKFILAQIPEEEKIPEEDQRKEQDAIDAIDLSDPVFIEAAETVIRHKQGSVSLLQRKLGIGYQRAARLIDKLEEAPLVSAYDGSKAREVLVDRAYLDELLASRSLTGRN